MSGYGNEVKLKIVSEYIETGRRTRSLKLARKYRLFIFHVRRG